MASERPRWTVESASALLRRLLAEEPDQGIDRGLRERHLRPRAVLAQFELEKGGEAYKALGEDLVTLPRIPGEPQWYTLKPPSRMEGLRLLGNVDAMHAARRETVVTESGVLQQVLDEFLEGNYAAAESDDVPRVEAALQAAAWLAPYATRAPEAAAIAKRLAIRRLLYPMERLTRGFTGRQTELARLRAFVGVLEPQTRVEAVSRFLSSFRATRSPLMLHGIGGTGKSTLLAEFIRQHISGPVPFPWVYLDFDNPRLNVAVLSTLIEEAAEQLGAQYPGSDWTGLVEQTHSQSAVVEAANYESEEATRTLAYSDVALSERLRQDAATEAAGLFATHMRKAMESSNLERMMEVSKVLPLLIVLDTFEEVQKRGIEMARILWRFLRALQADFPRVRIVVSGRAPVPELAEYLASPEPLPLKEFDERAAIAFLMDRGAPTEEIARALYKQVGGNPLNLKLAAQVSRLEGVGNKGIEGLKTSSYFVFAAAEHVIQGQLYKRILDRIAPAQGERNISNEDLQKLAHPGLVVRRINREIIQHVLAVPCGLGEIDEGRASALFEALEKQVDLVTVEPDGALHHQQGVRRVMLKMLQAERPLQVQAIHKAAYEFYRSDATPAGRIERIYHGLQLGTEEQEVRRMWYPDAGESMLSSVDELPPSSQLLVYVLTLKEPPAAVRELATQDQWERLVEARARQALQYGDYELVRKLLSERDTRCEASALYAIAALVAMHSGDQAAAAEQLRRGIDSAQAVNRIDRLAELWRLRGELFEQHRDFANATAALAEAQGLAMRMGAPALALQICAERSRLHEAAGAPPPGPAEIEEIVKACGDSDFASVRLQLRGLFRNCGPYSVALLVKGLRVFKLQFIPRTPDNEEWTQELMLGAQQGRLNEYLQGRLEREPENETVRRVIADALEDALNPNRSARSA